MKSRIVAGLIGLTATGMILAAEPGEGPSRPGAERPQHPQRRSGPPREKGDFFGHMLRDLDADRSGTISFGEFSRTERVGRLTEDQRRQLFDRLDKDKDGEIRREEISRSDPNRRPWGERRGDHPDTNKDGKVSLEEFRKSPRMAEVPPARQEELFRKMDRNGDGFLDRKDFQGHRPERPGGGERPQRGPGPFGGPKAFDELDTDHDGSLSFKEFRQAPRIEPMDEDRQEDLFENLDRDDDGTLKREEMTGPHGPGMGPGEAPGGPGGKGRIPGQRIPGQGPKPPRRGDGQSRPEAPKAQP